MSYHTLLGAIAVPREVADPISYWDPATPHFRAGSRNGWFQSACQRLLDEMADYEELRFLAAQAWTRESLEDGGRTTWTLLDQTALGRVATELDALLERCSNKVDDLTERLFAPDGWSVDYVRTVFSFALSRREFTNDVTDGGEDDSPEFLFSVLVNFRKLIRLAQEQQFNLVYYNWLPN